MEEILKVLLPSIGTGIITFLITKYSLNRNQPLNNYNIAYNRIYYPLRTLLYNKASQSEVINDIEKRVVKYHKYFNPTTIRLFQQYRETQSNNMPTKRIYEKLENDIVNNSYFLRRMLAYPQFGFFDNFKVLDTGTQIKIVSLLSLLIFYLTILVAMVPIDWLRTIMIPLMISSGIITIATFLIWICYLAYKNLSFKILKLFSKYKFNEKMI